MVFKDFFVFGDSLQFFGDWTNTYLTEHLLITAFTCSWLINVSAALFWNEKHSLTVIKDMQMLNPHLIDRNQQLEKHKIKKSIWGAKVKNGNGRVKVFICYCSTPRSVCTIQIGVRNSIHYENWADLFWF